MQDASKPIWFKKEKGVEEINVSNEDVKIDTGNLDFKKMRLLVATPVHSEVSMHYAESLLTLQGVGHSLDLVIDFLLLKSSLVTQGRNLCVSNFLNKKEYTHMLFIDSDISFDPSSVIKLLRCDKDVISIPYPMKTINWNKVHGRIQDQKDININDLSRSGFMFPIKVEDQQSIIVSKGIMEVTHAPTGFMLIKKEAILKMIEKYPHLKIKQPTIMNGEAKDTDNLWNFFDTWFDQETNKYYGEDFAFCQKFRDIGGKCYCYVDDFITHVGEYSYEGKFIDELINTRKIDESNKNK
jgi:hypothetical protein